jgi:hypothetical protein
LRLPVIAGSQESAAAARPKKLAARAIRRARRQIGTLAGRRVRAGAGDSMVTGAIAGTLARPDERDIEKAVRVLSLAPARS